MNEQRRTLDSIDFIKTIKKETDSTFIDHQKKTNQQSDFDQKLRGLLSVPPMPKEKK